MRFIVAAIPVAIAMALLLVSVLSTHWPLFYALGFGWMSAIAIGLATGHSCRKLVDGTKDGVGETWFVVGLLLFVGALLASWGRSETVASLVYYGLSLQPSFLAVEAFVGVSLLSMILGTSVGTLAIVGPPIIGLALSLHLSVPLVGGALVSGAFVGDRSSPVSSSAQLTALVTGTRYADNVPTLVRTGLPALIASAIVFTWLGWRNAATYRTAQAHHLFASSNHSIQMIRGALLGANPHISWWVALVPLSVIGLVIARVPIRTSMLVGAALGATVSFAYHTPILSVFHDIAFGYPMRIERDGTPILLGGLVPMGDQVVLIALAGAFYGVLAKTDAIETLLGPVVRKLQGNRGIFVGTGVLSMMMALVTCTQTLAVLVPGKMLSKRAFEQSVSMQWVVRGIADFGVVLAGFIPWNLNAILAGAAIQMSVTSYMSNAWFLFLLPIYSVVAMNWTSNRKSLFRDKDATSA